jgi:hypothetical protein
MRPKELQVSAAEETKKEACTRHLRTQMGLHEETILWKEDSSLIENSHRLPWKNDGF